MTQRMNGFRQKLEKLLHFQIWLGAKYCDIPYLTIPTHKNLLKYSTVSTCHFIKIRSRRGIGRISYIQLYTSHNTTARIVQKASTANTNRNTSPCCENHVARSFVVSFWNFLFKPSQSYQYHNQQYKTQQKNGIGQKFKKLKIFQYWLTTQHHVISSITIPSLSSRNVQNSVNA